MEPYIITVVVCAVLTLLYTLAKTRTAGAISASAASGLAGLFVMNALPVSGGFVSINLFTLCLAFFFGIPGVAGILLMRLICAL